jgi:hypothetical protein
MPRARPDTVSQEGVAVPKYRKHPYDWVPFVLLIPLVFLGGWLLHHSVPLGVIVLVLAGADLVWQLVVRYQWRRAESEEFRRRAAGTPWGDA